MGLSLYNQKRKFSETPEPEGKEKSSKGALRFVIQKHDASQVHYDFRLEMDGVLKSWAVPKGPSINPSNKRLAMQVEDHPFDYRNFEGVIPEGNYGAGTVIVWDEGNYEPEKGEGLSKKEREQLLLQQYEQGKLTFILHGKKLNGLFTLFRMKGNEEAWLLVKKKDEFAAEDDITTHDKSVKSGKTLQQVATEKGVVLNHPQHEQTAKPKAAKSASKTKHLDPEQLGNFDEKAAEMVLNGHRLQVTNLKKLYWTNEQFTKGDMLYYYHRIAPYMLTYMKGRPQSLHRHPNGINGKHFFQKDMRGKMPDWIPTHEDYSESTDETIQYMICNNEAALIYMANLGCIEMHPWHSRHQSPDHPDYCLIDLDPDKKNSFEQVIDTALVVKALLDEMKVAAYCKTSGSTGLHIYIPLGAKYTYDESKQFAELLVGLVHQELPELTSLERNPAKRKGKIYLDFLQNRQAQTAAAPYSLRPKPGVPVSTPLDWSEVKKGLTPTTYNARNIFDRLKTEGDLFTPVLGKGVDLKRILKRLLV